MAGEDVFPAWSCSVEETLSHLRVDASAGLSEAEVKTRQEQYGLNELEHEEGTPFWKLVLEQFEDTLVRILLAAAAVSFLLAYLDNQVLLTRDLPLSGHGYGRAARWSLSPGIKDECSLPSGRIPSGELSELGDHIA